MKKKWVPAVLIIIILLAGLFLHHAAEEKLAKIPDFAFSNDIHEELPEMDVVELSLQNRDLGDLAVKKVMYERNHGIYKICMLEKEKLPDPFPAPDEIEFSLGGEVQKNHSCYGDSIYGREYIIYILKAGVKAEPPLHISYQNKTCTAVEQ